jgi:hypothetical protein
MPKGIEGQGYKHGKKMSYGKSKGKAYAYGKSKGKLAEKAKAHNSKMKY